MNCVADQRSGFGVRNVEKDVLLIDMRRETDLGTEVLHSFELGLIPCPSFQEPLLDIARTEGPAAGDPKSSQFIREPIDATRRE